MKLPGECFAGSFNEISTMILRFLKSEILRLALKLQNSKLKLRPKMVFMNIIITHFGTELKLCTRK